MDSLRAFSVELTISVANMDRSFGDNCSFCWISSSLAGFARVLAVVLVHLGFVSGAVFEFFVGINLSGFDPPGFGNRRSLSSATVAVEQVAVELAAPRMESALAIKVDILEQRKGAVQLESKHYPTKKHKIEYAPGIQDVQAVHRIAKSSSVVDSKQGFRHHGNHILSPRTVWL